MYIYKITHKSTHQCYIGQTTNIMQRWLQHISSQDSPIQRAIQEEGICSFTFEVIEECSEVNSDERESYWINYYHAYETGYNTNSGNFSSKNLGEGTKPSIAKKNRGGVNSPDGVDAYDPDTGKLIAHYASIADANRALGKEGTGNISAVCRGRGKTAYGYVWRYTTPQEN